MGLEIVVVIGHAMFNKLFLVVMLVCFNIGIVMEGQWTTPDNSEHEYSLTTCGDCVKTAGALRKEGIEFTELYIDKDQQFEDEPHIKMRNAGISTGFYYTPVLDIHGTILANNPAFNVILKEVDKHYEPIDG